MPSKLHRQLVEIIVGERKAAGIRQVELAKRMKRSQTWVARLEGGDRTKLDVDEFWRLAQIIGFDPVKALQRLSH